MKKGGWLGVKPLLNYRIIKSVQCSPELGPFHTYQKLQAVIDQRLVKEDTVSSQTVSSVTNNFGTPLRVISIQPRKYAVVWNAILLELSLPSFGSPRLLNRVVVLVITNRDVLVHVVSDRLRLCVQLRQFLRSLGLLLLLLSLQFLLLLE
jgi:hypothetical protein